MSINVLAVEDDPSVAELVALALEDADCNVTLAANADEAVAAIDERPHPFDVVLTDNFLPGTSGNELVRELSERKFPGRIVVLSGYVAPEQKAEFRRLGVSALISKPFQFDELRRAVGAPA